jgi:Acetyltransferase (GNAT) domain
LNNISEQLTPYFLSQYESYQCYFIPTNEIADYIAQIEKSRYQAFTEKFIYNGVIGDADGGRDYLYHHLIVYNSAECEIVCAIRMRFSNERFNDGDVVSCFESIYPGINTTESLRFIESGRAFLQPKYDNKSFLLLFLFKNLLTIALLKKNSPLLIAIICCDNSNHPQEVVDFFYTCLSNNHFYSTIHIPKALYPYSDSNVLTAEHKAIASNIKSLTVMKEKIKELFNEDFKTHIMLDYYLTNMGFKVSGFSVSKEFNDNIEVLIHNDLRRIPPELLNNFVAKHIVDDFKSYWQKETV